MSSSLLYAAFFFSGFTALLYEIVWQRLLVRLTGATIPATVATFCLFMLGLALGSYFSIKFCERSSRPLKIYSVAEAVIALAGLMILGLCDQRSFDFGSSLISSLPGASLLRASLVSSFSIAAGAAMTLGSAAMSVAFNAGVRALSLRGDVESTNRNAFQSAGNNAYLLNLCGAFFGSVCGAFLILPGCGLSVTAYSACAVSAALSAFVGFGRAERTVVAPETAEELRIESHNLYWALAMIFCFSFLSMSLEVTWTRLMCLVCGSSTYALGSVLSVILFSLTAAAIVVSRVGEIRKFPFALLLVISGCAATFLTLDLQAMPYLTWAMLYLQNMFESLGLPVLVQFMAPRLLLAFALIAGNMFCLGLVTPLFIRAIHHQWRTLKSTAYGLTFSTAGSIAGALFATLLIIPNDFSTSGIEVSLLVCIGLLAVLGVICVTLSSEKISSKIILSGIALIVSNSFVVLIHPQWQVRLMSLGPSFVSLSNQHMPSFDEFRSRIEASGQRTLYYKEGDSATISVETNEKTNVIFLKSNGKVESALPADWQKPAPTSDYRTQMFLGILPVLCRGPEARNLKALSIGFGSGITSGLMLSFQQIESLTNCEIEPAIYQCAHLFEKSNFQPLRKNWLLSGRMKTVCGDARTYLNQSEETFDIVVSQPSEPWISGSSDLFTYEFFKLVRSRLNARGVFVQWFQLYCIDEHMLASLIFTFHRAFPNTYIFHPANSGDLVVVGIVDEKKQHDVLNKITERELRVAGMSQESLDRLKQSNSPSTSMLNSDFVLTPPDVLRYLNAQGIIDANTDSRLATEYQLPQELLLGESHIVSNIDNLKKFDSRR